MPANLPPEIKVIPIPTGERYELPQRHVGCLRVAAWPIIIFSVFNAVFGIYISLIGSGLFTTSENGSSSTGPLVVLFGIVWFLIMLLPVLLGCFMIGGHNTIEVHNEWLIAAHHSGPLRLWRKMLINNIRTFQIKTGNPGNKLSGIHPMIGTLKADLVGGQRRIIAWGYHRDTLQALAQHLTERFQLHVDITLLDPRHASIPIEEQSSDPESLIEGLGKLTHKKIKPLDVPNIPQGPDVNAPKPTYTDVRLELHKNGLTFTIPSVGIRKGSKGILAFSLSWNLFMALFTGLWFAGHRSTQGWNSYIVLMCLTTLWGLGIATLIAAINIGKRRAIIDVVGETLLISHQSIFKIKQQEVHRDNIESIRLEYCGKESDDVPILNLQINCKQGKMITMLNQLSNNELAWIASELRKALNL